MQGGTDTRFFSALHSLTRKSAFVRCLCRCVPVSVFITNEKMEYVLMGAAVIVIIVALSYFRTFILRKPLQRTKTAAPVFASCPVCGMPLVRGDTLRSKVFRPMDVGDQLCVIYGCPHCYPAVSPDVNRTCPVCRKPLSSDDYLIARLFNKTKTGKKHVIINGCVNCSRRRI